MLSKSRERTPTMEDLEKKTKRNKSNSVILSSRGLRTGELNKSLAKAKKQFSKNRSHSTSRERSRSVQKL
jgi:hypothetical protein